MALDELKHAQRERLLYLDRCFTWRGRANRRDLVKRFGVSVPQAALDFKAYLERAGRFAPRYDGEKKTYLAHAKHTPLAPEETLGDWESAIRDRPVTDFCELPTLSRATDPEVIARINRAIEEEQAIKICYTSMTSGEQTQQWLAPTHFASDGTRVHIRAFSFKHAAFRDYLPIRISSNSSFATRRLSRPLPADTDWTTLVRFTLEPLKTLTPEQARAVRREYAFTGDTLTIETRKALEFYFQRRWGLNQDGTRLALVKTEYVVGGLNGRN